ncbi:MAG: putative inorganic carbon transporter subunit DabA [Pseudomonadota bacterium]
MFAAPREHTAAADLSGRSFLHTYDWRHDLDFKVLELILTAPVVVASWISLQYFGSTVDNDVFGSGNKVLHNVSGRMGVVEGNGGDLRVGLPLQSVHDGEKFIHEPVRLSVFVEAPEAAINDIISRHEMVRHLFDNGWLHLLRMDDMGAVVSRYEGGLQWSPTDETDGVGELLAEAA